MFRHWQNTIQCSVNFCMSQLNEVTSANLRTLPDKSSLLPSTHIINEVSYVSRVGQAGSDRVLRLSNHRSLIHSAHSCRLVDDMIQGLGLLQLAQVIVLDGGH